MKLDILAFGAHPDDVELSASGTVILAVKQGKKVGVVDLTEGELGTRGSVKTRYQEAGKASEIMGLSARENLQMPDGFFTHSKENQLKIVEQVRRFRPEIVLCNAVSDRHPDHGKGSKLVSDALFISGLRKVETTWQGISQEAWRPKAVYHYIQDRYLKPDFVIDVSSVWQQRMKAVMAYDSQFYNPDSKEPVSPIATKEFLQTVEGKAAIFGRNIGVQFAEGFTTERTLGVRDLFDIQ